MPKSPSRRTKANRQPKLQILPTTTRRLRARLALYLNGPNPTLVRDAHTLRALIIPLRVTRWATAEAQTHALTQATRLAERAMTQLLTDLPAWYVRDAREPRPQEEPKS